MDLLVEFLSRWGWFLVSALTAVSLTVSDYTTGEYRGFKQARMLVLMPALLAGGCFFAWLRGETGAETAATMLIGCALLFVIPRIQAEIHHRIRKGVWLSFKDNRVRY